VKIFLDTSALVAYYNRDDSLHDAATGVMNEFLSGKIPVTKFFVSDYVFDETVTVIECVLRKHDLALEVGEALRASPRTMILRVDEPIFEASWKLFRNTSDASFTDCTSFVLIKSLGIQAAFTFDGHFKKAGIRTIP
jgi:predicted nucleic acid-binding protein